MEAFAECLIGCGRLLSQAGDLRNGVLVSRCPGQQVKIPVIKTRHLEGILPVKPGSVSQPDLRGIAFDGVYPGGGGFLGDGKNAPVGLHTASVIGPCVAPGRLAPDSARNAVISRNVDAISHSWRRRVVVPAA